MWFLFTNITLDQSSCKCALKVDVGWSAYDCENVNDEDKDKEINENVKNN